ncbi:hypothetical protein MKW98_010541, partial [Papaver atlanticum]
VIKSEQRTSFGLSMRFTMMEVGFDLGNIAPVDKVTGISYTEWVLSKERYLIFYQMGILLLSSPEDLFLRKHLESTLQIQMELN